MIFLLKTKNKLGDRRSDDWKNLLIHGDNLLALKLLKRNIEIKKKIKLVYIDPPYSTNQIFKIGVNRTSTISRSIDDSEAYRDLIVGKKYLQFIKERVLLIKELMAEDASIYIHIDTKIGHYLKVLLDEIFGSERFINDITRIKCNPKNFSRRAFGNIKDMVLFYSKTKKYIWNDARIPLSDEEIFRLFPRFNKDGFRYTTVPLHAPGETLNGATGNIWKGLKPPKGRHWRTNPTELERLDLEGRIEWSANGNPRKIIYLNEIQKKGKKRQDIWDFKDNPYPLYPTEKNIEMLKMIVSTSSNPDDIVLDCFSGSGSTLLAAEILGRRWIGIDNSELAIKTTIKRFSENKIFSEFLVQKLVTIKEK